MSHAVTLVTRTHGHTFRKCHMYSCPNICIIHFFSHFPMKSLFPVICFVWDATFTDNILSQGSNISLVVTFLGSHILGSKIFWEFTIPEVIFPGISHFPGSQISQGFTIPGKVIISGMSYFPGCQISVEVMFPRKSQFLGNHNFREVKFPGKSQLPGIHMSREFSSLLVSISNSYLMRIAKIWRLDGGGGGEEGGEKRLVDLRRLSLMASPQVKTTPRQSCLFLKFLTMKQKSDGRIR